MDAALIIARIARAIERHGLDAIMIGNAAAALHGAPVTTVDIDFSIRNTPGNRKKVTKISTDLGAVVYRPFFPVGEMLRLMNDDESLQLDFMGEVSGVRSFEDVRERSEDIAVAGATVRIAALADIIEMKRAANRPRDRAVLEDLELTLEKPKLIGPQRSALLHVQNDRLHLDMVRRRVAAPIEHRTNFLRRRVGICATAL